MLSRIGLIEILMILFMVGSTVLIIGSVIYIVKKKAKDNIK